MATTGELQAIIEDLQLIHVGDAASYLGEETPPQTTSEDTSSSQQEAKPTKD